MPLSFDLSMVTKEEMMEHILELVEVLAKISTLLIRFRSGNTPLFDDLEADQKFLEQNKHPDYRALHKVAKNAAQGFLESVKCLGEIEDSIQEWNTRRSGGSSDANTH